MLDTLKALLKQPYWIISLVLGAVLITFPCLSVDKDHWVAHPPNTLLPVVVGIALLFVSLFAFVFTIWTQRAPAAEVGAGLDLTRVQEANGVMWTTVSGCEIRVTNGRLQDFSPETGTVIVLPCNEYFDDQCAGDVKSALGAYVNQEFEGQVEAFISLLKDECKKKLGAGVMQQKTDNERAESFGAGRCLLLLKPLGRSIPVALVSTTTQRAGQGLASRISYLFDGTRELVTKLADARLNEVAMPILGAGHGRIDPPLALVGLLLAVSEAARYGQGGQRLRRVTIVVFKRGAGTPPEVDHLVVRRTLALIGSPD